MVSICFSSTLFLVSCQTGVDYGPEQKSVNANYLIIDLNKVGRNLNTELDKIISNVLYTSYKNNKIVRGYSLIFKESCQDAILPLPVKSPADNYCTSPSWVKINVI